MGKENSSFISISEFAPVSEVPAGVVMCGKEDSVEMWTYMGMTPTTAQVSTEEVDRSLWGILGAKTVTKLMQNEVVYNFAGEANNLKDGSLTSLVDRLGRNRPTYPGAPELNISLTNLVDIKEKALIDWRARVDGLREKHASRVLGVIAHAEMDKSKVGSVPFLVEVVDFLKTKHLQDASSNWQEALREAKQKYVKAWGQDIDQNSPFVDHKAFATRLGQAAAGVATVVTVGQVRDVMVAEASPKIVLEMSSAADKSALDWKIRTSTSSLRQRRGESAVGVLGSGVSRSESGVFGQDERFSVEVVRGMRDKIADSEGGKEVLTMVDGAVDKMLVMVNQNMTIEQVRSNITGSFPELETWMKENPEQATEMMGLMSMTLFLKLDSKKIGFIVALSMVLTACGGGESPAPIVAETQVPLLETPVPADMKDGVATWLEFNAVKNADVLADAERVFTHNNPDLDWTNYNKRGAIAVKSGSEFPVFMVVAQNSKTGEMVLISTSTLAGDAYAQQVIGSKIYASIKLGKGDVLSESEWFIVKRDGSKGVVWSTDKEGNVSVVNRDNEMISAGLVFSTQYTEDVSPAKMARMMPPNSKEGWTFDTYAGIVKNADEEIIFAFLDNGQAVEVVDGVASLDGDNFIYNADDMEWQELPGLPEGKLTVKIEDGVVVAYEEDNLAFELKDGAWVEVVKIITDVEGWKQDVAIAEMAKNGIVVGVAEGDVGYEEAYKNAFFQYTTTVLSTDYSEFVQSSGPSFPVRFYAGKGKVLDRGTIEVESEFLKGNGIEKAEVLLMAFPFSQGPAEVLVGVYKGDEYVPIATHFAPSGSYANPDVHKQIDSPEGWDEYNNQSILVDFVTKLSNGDRDWKDLTPGSVSYYKMFEARTDEERQVYNLVVFNPDFYIKKGKFNALRDPSYIPEKNTGFESGPANLANVAETYGGGDSWLVPFSVGADRSAIFQ